ncbi:MAG: thiamine phosphate synthase [Tannerellaceae bacterium]|nr:thiamine phosphate synthase [Tannerellaceae bacterium]
MKGLLFISHSGANIGLLEGIEFALKGGCRHIQLRAKGAAVVEVETAAWKAKALCEQYGGSLYVNDHVDVCLKVRAKGVHLGKSDMSPCEARKRLGRDFLIGGTANTFEDIRRLNEEGVDYIGLGPFRFTSTKDRLSPLLGLEGYKQILEKCRIEGITLPIMAIGGIVLTDVPVIRAVGLAGIAVSSAILGATDPVEETKAFCNALDVHAREFA